MRSEVRAALEAARGAALVYDLAAVAARMDAAAAAGRRHGVRVLLAMKAFPADPVRALAAARLDGFDAGSAGEVAALAGRARGRVVSITDPAAGSIDPGALAGADLWVTCEDPARAGAAPPAARLAVRLAASHLVPGDDAIGGIVEDGGRRSSRFGVRAGPGARDAIAAIVAAGGGRVRGLHVHHGGVAPASPDRLVRCARAAVALAAEAGLPLAWLDLGGGLHLLADRLDETFAAVRAAVPAGVELVVEPGRLLSTGAGFAAGRVRAARELPGRSVRVVDLSRACHLRWQQVVPVAAPAPTGAARRVLFAGPTCYEEDVVGEWKLEPSDFPVGAALVVAGVTGYALAWNTGFGGVPPADVVLVA
jgi:diaminopimelate decarboxylase